jgi:CDP-diacylglycerol--serine O-phosphatidyltransferase
MRRPQSGMTSLALAGYLIFLAMIADMLDGSVARLTRTTSSFGGQLDSLSDVISFGIAPAFIMVKLVEFHLDHIRLESHGLLMLLRRGTFFAAILYAMCAVVRLARFNVENEEDEMAHMNFSGLPSPGAAGVIAGIVVLHQQLMMVANVLSQRLRILELVTVFVFPAITLLTGILMVSRVRYPHAANQLLRGKKTLPTLLVIFAAGLFAVWNIQLALVIGFCGYALYGVIRWIITGVFKKPRSGIPVEADRLKNETQAAGQNPSNT